MGAKHREHAHVSEMVKLVETPEQRTRWLPDGEPVAASMAIIIRAITTHLGTTLVRGMTTTAPRGARLRRTRAPKRSEGNDERGVQERKQTSVIAASEEGLPGRAKSFDHKNAPRTMSVAGPTTTPETRHGLGEARAAHLLDQPMPMSVTATATMENR